MVNISNENVSRLILICRLCGNASDSYINIFGQDGVKHFVDEKILAYLKVEVSNSDLLPKIICKKCYHVINEFHNLFLTTKKVQLLLKNTINESLCSIKIKIDLPVNETCNNNTNSIKKDCNVQMYDEKKEILEIEKCLNYETESFSSANKSLDTENQEEIAKLMNTNDESVLECDKPVHNNYLRIDTAIDNNDFRYQDSPDFIDVKENSTENSSIESIETNDESNESSTWHFKNDLADEAISLPCTLCTQVFMGAKELIKHYDENHHSLTPIFKCALCGRMYKVLKNFYVHFETHNSVNKHTCEICGKSFTRNWTLRVHASVHSDAKPFNCDECDKSFKNLCSLKIHKKSHLPDECKLIYTCAFCGKSFKSKFILVTHERIHTGQKDFTCDICSKSFSSKSSLLSHIKIHNNNQQTKCPVCYKLLRTEKLFKRHLTFHTFKKQLKCEYCGKEFHYTTQLNEHLRLHTGELPYECEYCQKRFRLNNTLIIHRRQHTGIKPYKCKACDHSFTNWPNYNKHMKRKHYNTIVKENNDELILLKI